MDDPVETVYDMLYANWSLGSFVSENSNTYDLSKGKIGWVKHSLENPKVGKPSVLIKRGRRKRGDEGSVGYIRLWYVHVLPYVQDNKDQHEVMWRVYDEVQRIADSYYLKNYGDAREVDLSTADPSAPNERFPQRDYEVTFILKYERARPP